MSEEMVGRVRVKLAAIPHNVKGWTALAALHHDNGEMTASRLCIEAAITVDPAFAPALSLLVGLQNDLEQAEDAERWARRAIVADAGFVDARLGLANALALQERCEEAAECYGAAAGLGSESAARSNMGLMMLCKNGPHPDAWMNRDHKWLAHEGYRRRAAFQHLPRWDGSPKQHRLVVWLEQGVGDEMCFVTVADDLVKAGYDVTWVCDERLVSLFQRSYPKVRFMPNNPETVAWCSINCDVQCPSGTVAGMLRPTFESFPREMVPLKVDGALVAEQYQWLRQFLGEPRKLAVGVIWRSLLQGESRAIHYTTLDDLLPILSLPNVLPVSIQYGYYDPQIDEFEQRTGIKIIRPPIDLKDDFERTAALLSVLNCAAGPGTTALGLAAAVGTPAHILGAPKMRDWLALGTEGYPWLPLVRLYRREGRDWTNGIQQIAAQLSPR